MTPATKTAGVACYMSLGRPSKYTDELADRIIEMLLDGHGLRHIQAQPNMPAAVTIIRWKNTIPAFSKLYEEARRIQLELMAEDILTIADGARDFVQAARLRVDARKWLLSKLARHVYGDSPQDEPVVEADLDLSLLSDVELDAYEQLVQKASKDRSAA